MLFLPYMHGKNNIQLARRPGGAAPPEAVVPPDTFIETMIERGLHIKMTWHDGHVSVGERDC